MKTSSAARVGSLLLVIGMLAAPGSAQAQTRTWHDTTHDVIINFAEHGGGDNAAPEDIETIRAEYTGAELALVIHVSSITVKTAEHLAVHLHIKVSDSVVYGVTLRPDKSRFTLHNVGGQDFQCGSTRNASSFNITTDAIRVGIDRSCLPVSPGAAQLSKTVRVSLDTVYTGADFTRFDPYPNSAGSFSPALDHN